MSELFVVQLALAWYFVVNAMASAAAIAYYDEAEASSHACQAGAHKSAWLLNSPGVLLGLRLMPTLVSILFVAALFVPAFVRLEPDGARETLGRTAIVLGIAAVLFATRAVVRLLSHVCRTARLVSVWSTRATTVHLDAVPVPAFVVDTDFPVMSLVGILRPRLFIARQVIETLTPAELRTAISHEMAHLRARDNLKRLLLAATPDLLGWTRTGRAIEASWRAAAEYSADDHAAAGDRRRAVSLASALVKVARLAVDRPCDAHAFAAMLHDGGPIAQRVERLVEPPARPSAPRRRGRLAIVSATAVVVGVASFELLLPVVHTLTEVLVQLP